MRPSSVASISSGPKERLAPGETMMVFSPLGVTVIKAEPVGTPERLSTRLASTPLSRRFFTSSSPKGSSPTLPNMATSAPRRAAATAWLAPLPPGKRESWAPVTVSPGSGRRLTLRTKSWLIEPTTNTLAKHASCSHTDLNAFYRMSSCGHCRGGGSVGSPGFAGAALLGSAGCGGEGESEEAIGWQAIPGYSLQAPDENRVEYIQNAISSWEQSSGYTIDPLVTSSNVNEAMALLLEQASQSRAPDLAMVDSYIFPRFYEYVRPVGDYLGGISLDDYFPFIREGMSSPDGEVRGMQFTTDVRVMYYRRDLIPTPPSSWGELLQTGRDLLSEDENLTPYLFPAGRDEATVTTSLFPYFWAQGGELVDGEGNPIFGEGENRE